jgi:hypothetical protein
VAPGAAPGSCGPSLGRAAGEVAAATEGASVAVTVRRRGVGDEVTPESRSAGRRGQQPAPRAAGRVDTRPRVVNMHQRHMSIHASWVRPLAVLVLAGTALLAVGAIAHPVLPADAEAQLRIMAATVYWRPIHLAMIAGSSLVVVGIWLRLAVGRPRRRPALVAGLACVAVGLVLNALDIGFMAGHGAADAVRYAAGDVSVVPGFGARHMEWLMTARLGNAAVAVGCLLLGWVEWGDAARPRWMALLAWLAAAGGAIGVLMFEPWTRGAVAAVALFSAWAAATALLALAPR